MKLTTPIVAGTAALALAGGLFAAQASADPTTAPTPTATTSADANRGAGVAWFYRALTDVQRQCLADAGLQRPEGRLTGTQVLQLQQQVQAWPCSRSIASASSSVISRAGSDTPTG